MKSVNAIFAALKIGLKNPRRILRPKQRNNTGENPRRNGLFPIDDDSGGLGGLAGGRDRDRTCDPLDVNEVLSR
jgi:hypothetical protein